jgi:putative two-component system response regulator
MKILVVDDDDIALAIAGRILEQAHYGVELARDGAEALEVLRTQDIQIIIADWNMPNMNGLELCQHLREAPTIRYIYIILITSRTGKDEMIQGLTAGADEFISKPFVPEELLVRVRNAERILALETTSVMLFSLARLAEWKDTDSELHLEFIRIYARVLAEQIVSDDTFHGTLPPQFADMIFLTSPLHDIGKVGIPDYVLLKHGSLSDDEWQIMKRHTEIGAETLNACLKLNPGAEHLRIARDIAWAHHEHWDGSGYPRRLKGEEIPLAARIVALADVYDAVTQTRTYKAALPHETARGIIVEGRGTHFDPQVVDAFLKVEETFMQIRGKLPAAKPKSLTEDPTNFYNNQQVSYPE